MNDRDYTAGSRSVWRKLLRDCMTGLGFKGKRDPEAHRVALLVEREDVVEQLRCVCEDHGDNDWDDTAHLGDVIEKHLAPYLDDRKRK